MPLSLIERARGIIEFEANDEDHLTEILEHAYLLDFVTSKAESASEMDARILKSLVKPGRFKIAIFNQSSSFLF